MRGGITAGDFWEMTPRELAAALQAAAWRREQVWQQNLALAWHMVALDRTKRLPPLARLLHPPETRKLTEAEKARRGAEFAEMREKLEIRK